MAFYTDPNCLTTDVVNVGTPDNTISLSTSTASGTNTFIGTNTTVAGTIVLPKFVNPTQIVGVRAYCMTASAASVPNIGMYFLNGTNTFGTITLTTAAAAGSTYDATISALSTDSHGVATGGALFAANGQPTCTVLLQTATASGGTIGAWAFDLYVKQTPA